MLTVVPEGSACRSRDNFEDCATLHDVASSTRTRTPKRLPHAALWRWPRPTGFCDFRSCCIEFTLGQKVVHPPCQSEFCKSLCSLQIVVLQGRRSGPVCPRAVGVRQFVAQPRGRYFGSVT